MLQPTTFSLHLWDYLAFGGFLVVVSTIGYLAGRKERDTSRNYFLAGNTLPWYVVGGSFIASNISSEQFIGMIGAAVVYGICVGMMEWMNVATFSLLIWFFIPFLLASKVFTIPEFLERRFSPTLRQLFAVITVICNVVAFLAAVLYGGALAIQRLFHEELGTLASHLPGFFYLDRLPPDDQALWIAIVMLAIVAGFWAIWGGLSSVAWIDLFTVTVMVLGGITVTIVGLYALAGEQGSLADGFQIMLERNQAHTGVHAEAVTSKLARLAGTPDAVEYNRLSCFQPATHPVVPWVSIAFVIFSVSVWYNVLNQFMIQRVLGAKDMYHARMGIVFAGFLKVLMPAIVVVPGLILFALHPEILLLPWEEVQPMADKGYVSMIQTLVPIGLRGLFLAALFGAIQSTVSAVLNSTATVFTMDIYKRMLRPAASEKHLVRVGVITSTVTLLIAIGLGGFIGKLSGGLFVYIQELYAFFAPPFAAIFLLGILWRRINSTGATATVAVGFGVGILMKVSLQIVVGLEAAIATGGSTRLLEIAPVFCRSLVSLHQDHVRWLDPYFNQAAVNWILCVIVCIVVSLLTGPPRPEQITDQLTFNWKKLNIFGYLGDHWYTSVITWWLVFVAMIVALLIIFSGLFF